MAAKTEVKYPPTPELDKQTEIIKSGRAEQVQEFLDWLSNERHYTFCEPDPDSLHGKYIPAMYAGPEQLMADFFGIDRDKIETERRAVLEYVRSQHDATA